MRFSSVYAVDPLTFRAGKVLFHFQQIMWQVIRTTHEMPNTICFCPGKTGLLESKAENKY